MRGDIKLIQKLKFNCKRNENQRDQGFRREFKFIAMSLIRALILCWVRYS